MLGPPKPRRLDEPVVASLEDLVPRDNFYRHLEAELDLGFVREWARERYAERGRPSIDPVVFFKLQLVMFFEGIRSERKLVETASLHLAHRWYLGYALDEDLPDHSSLTRIRQRLGVKIFERFFEKIVDLCQEAGLVWGQELYFDATKVEANAALDSLVPRFYHEAKAHAAGLFADDPAPSQDDGTDAGDPPPEGLLRLPVAAVTTDQPGEVNAAPWKLLEERRLGALVLEGAEHRLAAAAVGVGLRVVGERVLAEAGHPAVEVGQRDVGADAGVLEGDDVVDGAVGGVARDLARS